MHDRLSRELIDRITVKEFDLTLLSGWSNTVEGGNEAPKARIQNGFMTVTGRVSAGTIAKNTPIFNLPNDYKAPYNCYGTLRRFADPATEHLVRIYQNGAIAYIDNNFDLPASGVYWLNVRIPVKYVGGGRYLIDYLRLCILIGGAWHEWNRSCEQRTPSLICRLKGQDIRHMVVCQTAKWAGDCLGRRTENNNGFRRDIRRMLVCSRSGCEYPGGTVYRRYKSDRISNGQSLCCGTVCDKWRESLCANEFVLCFFGLVSNLGRCFNRQVEITLERGCAA